MTEFVNRVNRDYRTILESMDDPKKLYEELSDGMTKKGCTFAGGPMPLYVKPYFIDGRQMPYIRYTTEVIVMMLNKVTDLYYQSDDSKPMFELSENETRLAAINPYYTGRVKITRNDAFMTDTSLKYVEFNADSPGGPMYTDVQGELIYENSAFKQLLDKYMITRNLIMPQVLNTLIYAYRQWGGKKDKPNIAISGGKGGGTTPEFLAIVEWLKTLGFKAAFCPPPEWQYDGNRLTTPDGFEPDVIYRRGWIGDWLEYMDEIKPVLQALQDRKVCMANPLNSILASNKSLLAVLQDEKIFNSLDIHEQRVVKETIPWTRVVREQKTVYNNKQIDLVEHIGKNKNSFVLKPIDMYGGKDVIVGPVTEDSEWAQWIDKAVKGKFIVQEYVPIPEEELPTFAPDLQFTNKKINVNFYSYGGIYTGGVVRSSDSPVINVHKGGGMTPIMFVEPK